MRKPEIRISQQPEEEYVFDPDEEFDYFASQETKYPEVPMDKYENEIREMIRNNPSCVIVGETGSGKTTRIPEFLMREFPDAKIAITQPRRFATRSVAEYVARRRGNELGEYAGRKVGYKTKRENNITEDTETLFMTDGILLRKLQHDPLLRDLDVVMVDEAHERSLNIDFILGLLKIVQENRKKEGLPVLKIVITSATIEKEKFANFFGDSPTMEVEGRMFPVDVGYQTEEEVEKYAIRDRHDRIVEIDYISMATDKVKEICMNSQDGDILIFMPGVKEIKNTIVEINELNIQNIETLPLYADLPSEDQQKVLQKSRKRKIIVATNIAETSITIDGVKFVIDSGLIRQKQFNSKTGVSSSKLVEHAQSGCNQRMGRAGRTAPGKCYRLYTEDNFKKREKYQTPEILRSDLAHIVLQMKKMGIDNIQEFDFIDKPDGVIILRAIEFLQMLGALDEGENITEIGEQMADIPLRPDLAKMVLMAKKYNCVSSVCTISVMLQSERSIFLYDKDPEKDEEMKEVQAKFKVRGSDFLTLLKVFKEWSASDFSKYWAREHYLNLKQLNEIRADRLDLMDVLSGKNNQEGEDEEELFIVVEDKNGDDLAIQKCVSAGLSYQLMMGNGITYNKIVDKREGDKYIFIDRNSAIFDNPEFIIGSGVFETRSGYYASMCQVVNPEWLPEIAPQILRQENSGVYYDSEKDLVLQKKDYYLKDGRNKFLTEFCEIEDEIIVEEGFARAFSVGKVDLPVYRENKKVIDSLRELNIRSGGRVVVPDEFSWYKEKLAGAKSKKEAEQFEDKLAMKLGEFCPTEELSEINRLYPCQIIVNGSVIKVNYEYHPENPQAYYEKDRPEKFVAVLEIDNNAINSLQDFSVPQIGENDRPKVCFRLNYNLRFSSLQELRNYIEEQRVKDAWLNFKKPDLSGVLIDTKPLEPLPSLEGLGAVPVVYAKDSQQRDLVAYPSIRAIRDYSAGGYRYYVEYCQTESEAKFLNETSWALKEKSDREFTEMTEKERIDRERIERIKPLQERYDKLSFNDFYIANQQGVIDDAKLEELERSYRQVYKILRDVNGDYEYVGNIISDLELEIQKIKEWREKREEMIAEQKSRMKEMAGQVESREGSNLTEEEFLEIQKMWREAGNYLIENYYTKPNPGKAKKLLDEIQELLKPLTPEQQREKLFQKYTEGGGGKVEEKKLKGGSAGIIDPKKERERKKQELKEQKAQEQVELVDIEKPKEVEIITEEKRKKLLEQLEQALIFVNSASKKKVEPVKGKKLDRDDEKRNKLFDRASTTRDEIKKIKDELEKGDDYQALNSKVLEISRRAEKIAQEVARVESWRENWTDQFKNLSDYAKDVSLKTAEGLGERLNKEQLDSVLKSIKSVIIKEAKKHSDPDLKKINQEIENIVAEILS